MDLDALLRKNLEDLDRQIEVVNGIAARNRVSPEMLQLKDGSFMLTPLLIAKANVLLAMSIRQASKPIMIQQTFTDPSL